MWGQHNWSGDCSAAAWPTADWSRQQGSRWTSESCVRSQPYPALQPCSQREAPQHDEDHVSRRRPPAQAAGLRIIVDASAMECLSLGKPEAHKLDTGPARLRLIGSIEALGCWEGEWDLDYGVDLFWESHQWVSLVLEVPPRERIDFCIVRLEQEESHPGVLQGSRRLSMHNSRNFTWSAMQTVTAPMSGEIVEVTFHGLQSRSDSALKVLTRKMPRGQTTGFPPDVLLAHSRGSQRCYTFDTPSGLPLHFSLYLPPGFRAGRNNEHPEESHPPWPLLIFLHSMHSRLDGDNNLFYESDSPLRLLLGDARCPTALRERFVVLAPQCPADPDRGDGSGVWLRCGWYEDSSYDLKLETALAELLEKVVMTCNVDRCRVLVTGCSMGAYASLELAARWPGRFAAVVPVAAHYDLDPVESLVDRLTNQAIPLWFFHATNDEMCPFAPIENLVRQLRDRSRMEIRLTSFEDTWSNQGHCADRVAYWSAPASEGEIALGEQLCEWLLEQRKAMSS